jgi:hypothetical protein
MMSKKTQSRLELEEDVPFFRLCTHSGDDCVHRCIHHVGYLCAQAQEVDQQTPFKIDGMIANHSGIKFIYTTGKEVAAPSGSNGTITCVGGQPTGLP